MRYSRNLVILSILLTGIFALISLPKFTVHIADQQFTYPGIDMGLLVEGSKLGNFTPGEGLYPTKRISYVTEALYTPDVEVIKERLEASGLTDVKFSLATQGTKASLNFEFPTSYSDAYIQVLGSKLVAQGNVTFLQVDLNAAEDAEADTILGYVPKNSGLTKANVVSTKADRRNFSYSSTGETQNFAGLDITFLESETLTQAFSDSGYLGGSQSDPMALQIDGQIEFSLQALGDGKSVFAISLYSVDMPILKVTANYLKEGTGVNSVLSVGEISEIPATYSTSGRTILAVTFILSALLLTLLVLSREGKKFAFSFAVSFAFFIFLSVTLLKLGVASLSTGTIIGFSIMYILTAILLYIVLGAKINQKEMLKTSREVSIFIFLLTALLYVLDLTFGTLTEITVVVAVMAISYFFTNLLALRASIGLLNK